MNEERLSQDELVREIIKVRGIAAALQAMKSPLFTDLNKLLEKEGYHLVKTNKQTDETNRKG